MNLDEQGLARDLDRLEPHLRRATAPDGRRDTDQAAWDSMVRRAKDADRHRTTKIVAVAAVLLSLAVTGSLVATSRSSGHSSRLRVIPPTHSPARPVIVPWLNQPADERHPYPDVTTTTTALPPVPPGPPCHASALTHVESTQGAAGRSFVDVVFTNVSGQGCRLLGTPGIRFFNKAGSPVALTYGVASTDTNIGWRDTEPVYLPPGGQAQVTIGFSNVFGCSVTPAYAYVELVLPGTGDRIHLGLSGGPNSACSPTPAGQGNLGIGPIVPYPTPVPDLPPPPPFAALDYTVVVPLSVVAGHTLFYALTVSNPTAAPIELSPCPAYTEGLGLTSSTNVNLHPTYRLNCGPLPSLAPGQRVEFAMELAVPADFGAGPAELFWQVIGGVKGAASTATAGVTVTSG